MIRHSSSFFISLFLHTIIAVLLFYTWKNAPIFHQKKTEKKVLVPICCLVQKEPKAITQIKKKIKKPVPKKVKKIKEKKITVPIIKKKKLVEEELPKQIENVKEDILPKPIEKIIPEIIDDKKAKEEEKIIREQRVKQEYLDTHIQEIVKLLRENLYYPRSARKRGITGKVVVKFKLSTQAIVTSSKVINSQSEILSRAAIKTIENLSKKFPKPREELVLEVPITYELK